MTSKKKITVDMLENWLGHWRNTTNKLVPKEFETFGSERFAFESDPRLQILEKLHPKTLLAMAHLLNQLEIKDFWPKHEVF